MGRPVWVALVIVFGSGLLGAFLLGRALEKTTFVSKPSLAPRGAVVLENRALDANADGRVVTWRVGGHAEEPGTGLYGVTIWRGHHRLYSHRARPGAIDLAVEIGKLTGGLGNDVLVFDDLDGSGGCGVYRVLMPRRESVRQLHVQQLCEDQGSMHLRRDGLLVSLGIQRDPRFAQQAHCCYRFVRRALKRWQAGRLVTVSSTLERLRPEHPVPGGFSPG